MDNGESPPIASTATGMLVQDGGLEEEMDTPSEDSDDD
jgi:hypothetical protein